MTQSKLIGSAEIVRELKKYEPELFKQLKKDLRTDLNPIIKPIQGEINSEVTNTLRSVMIGRGRSESGMFHNGRSSWSGATITAKASTNPRSLIFIEAAGRNGKVGFNYAELAGIERRRPRPRSREYVKNGRTMRHAVNGQGLEFNAKLRREFGKPGRFAWIRVLKQKPQIEKKVSVIADRYNIKVNRRIVR